MTTWQAGLRGAAIALLVVLAIGGARHARRVPAERYAVLFDLCAIGYLLESAPDLSHTPRIWIAPLTLLSNLAAPVFQLWASAGFSDRFVAGPARWTPFVLMLGLTLAAITTDSHLVWQFVHACALVIVAAGIIAVLRGRRADLVERRRQARLVFACGVGAVIAFTTVLAVIGTAVQPAVGAVAGLALVAALLRLRTEAPQLVPLVSEPGMPLLGMRPVGASPLGTPPLRPSLLGTPPLGAPPFEVPPPGTPPLTAPPLGAPPLGAPTSGPTTADPEDLALAQRINALMAGERTYRDPELTVASLSQQVGCPEYRVRRAINGALGQRNFVAFVNGYRLAEAQGALADPAQARVPILTIALDAGFGSIGPFNRAFKAATGETPSEYRKRRLAPGASPLPKSGASPFPKSSDSPFSQSANLSSNRPAEPNDR